MGEAEKERHRNWDEKRKWTSIHWKQRALVSSKLCSMMICISTFPPGFGSVQNQHSFCQISQWQHLSSYWYRQVFVLPVSWDWYQSFKLTNEFLGATSASAPRHSNNKSFSKCYWSNQQELDAGRKREKAPKRQWRGGDTLGNWHNKYWLPVRCPPPSDWSSFATEGGGVYFCTHNGKVLCVK